MLSRAVRGGGKGVGRLGSADVFWMHVAQLRDET